MTTRKLMILHATRRLNLVTTAAKDRSPVGVDSPASRFYCLSVQTTVDIDESLLRQLEQQARQQGKPLGALLEQALRGLVRGSTVESPVTPQNDASEGLADNDPFFSALEEIRALGRLPSSHRQVNLQ